MRIDSGALKARLMNNPDAIAAIEELEAQAKRMGEQETVDMALTFGYSQERVVGQIRLSDYELVRALTNEGRYELLRVCTRNDGKNQLIGLSLAPMMVTPAVADVGWGTPSPKSAQINTSETPESGRQEVPTTTQDRDMSNDARDLGQWMGTDEEVAAKQATPTDVNDDSTYRKGYPPEMKGPRFTGKSTDDWVDERVVWVEQTTGSDKKVDTPTDDGPCGCGG